MGKAVGKSLSQIAGEKGVDVKRVRYAARKAGATAHHREGRTDYFDANGARKIVKAVESLGA